MESINNKHIGIILAFAFIFIFAISEISAVLSVSQTPLENFDVNTSTGMVRYRPLNMTWLMSDITSGISTTTNGIGTSANNANTTLSFWVNTTSNSGSQGLMSFGQNANADVATYISTSFIRASQGAGQEYSSNTSLPLSVWNNIVITYNSSNIVTHIYINGIDTLNLSSNRTETTTYTNYIGYSFSGAKLVGSIDDIRLYIGVNLEPSEISTLIANGRKVNTSLFASSVDTALKLYLPFREAKGTMSIDVLGKSNATLLTGATWQSDNINVTTLGYQVNISIVNITNALIFWDNYTLVNQLTSNNYTFSFLNNQTIYVLENYKLNQSKNLLYNPLWFSISNSTTRHIASNLSDSINATIITNQTNCGTIYKLNYTTHSGESTSWLGATAQAVCLNLSTIGQTLTVEPANSSNVLDYYYDITPPVLTINSPSNGQQFKLDDTISIDFSATDDIGTDYLWYSLQNVNYTYSLPTTILAETLSSGTHSLIFYANDTSGNLASSTITIKIGTTSLISTILKILIGILALGLCIYSISIFYSYVQDNFQQLNMEDFTKAGVTMLLVLILLIALITYIATLV